MMLHALEAGSGGRGLGLPKACGCLSLQAGRPEGGGPVAALSTG